MCCKVVLIDGTNRNHTKHLAFHKYRSNLQMCQTLDTIVHLGSCSRPKLFLYIIPQESLGERSLLCSSRVANIDNNGNSPIQQHDEGILCSTCFNPSSSHSCSCRCFFILSSVFPRQASSAGSRSQRQRTRPVIRVPLPASEQAHADAAA